MAGDCALLPTYVSDVASGGAPVLHVEPSPQSPVGTIIRTWDALHPPTAVQVPSEPPWSQLSHEPSQAVSQQTPSTKTSPPAQQSPVPGPVHGLAPQLPSQVPQTAFVVLVQAVVAKLVQTVQSVQSVSTMPTQPPVL